MPIEFLTTKRFHDITNGIGGIIYLPNGRIKFQSGLGKKSTSPSFGTIIYKLGKEKLTLKKLNLDNIHYEIRKYNNN